MDLGGTNELGLSASQLAGIADKFPPESESLWGDVRSLAARTTSGDAVAWHHFIMAVGNFKRQTQIEHYLPAALLPSSGADLPSPLSVFAADGSVFHLDRDKSDTWSVLEATHGIAVPTATTVLAALWPSGHTILDVRVIRAAIALTGQTNWAGGRHKTRVPDASWDFYIWYISLTRQIADANDGLTVGQVERALYLLDQKVPWTDEIEWRDLRAQFLTAADKLV